MALAGEIRSNAKVAMNNENRRIFFIGARKATSGRQAPNVAVTAAKPWRYRRDMVNIMILLDRVDYR
jgi:hypothetical protein